MGDYSITYFSCADFLRRMGHDLDSPWPPAVEPHRVLVADIQRAVAEHYSLPSRIMVDGSHFRKHARPRQVAMYLARELTPKSFPEIGRLFGGRDHTTIMHGIRQIERLRREDAELNAAIHQLSAELSTGTAA